MISIFAKAWDDYSWDEKTEMGIFSADDGEEDGEEVLREIDALHQPLTVTADKAKYFADLIFWLCTERALQPMRRAA